MILLTSTGPAIADSVRDGVSGHGEAVRSVITGSSLEAIVSAWGCRAIVYVAGDSMLAARVEPQPVVERARSVLLAAAMPGVEQLVAIMPSGEDYEEEERALEAGDLPTVILRCAPLVEELQSDGGREWMREGSRITTGAMLATTVVRALQDASWQGRKVEVPTIVASRARQMVRVRTRTSVPDLEGLPALA